MQMDDNTLGGLELELDFGISGLRMYVNVFSLEVPSHAETPHIAQVVIHINEERFVFFAHILQGGQRLLLPEEASNTIIEALSAGFPVTISTGRYRSVILPANFQKQYKALIKTWARSGI